MIGYLHGLHLITDLDNGKVNSAASSVPRLGSNVSLLKQLLLTSYQLWVVVLLHFHVRVILAPLDEAVNCPLRSE